MLLQRFLGAQNVCIPIWLPDSSSSTGAGKLGLITSSPGLVISTRADVEASATAYTAAGATVDTIATLGTYAAPTAGHCRMKEVDQTNHPGMYELQFANARLAVANASYLYVTVQAPGSNVPPTNLLIDLDAQSDVRAFGGVANPGVSSGVPTVNLTQIGGVASRVTKMALYFDNLITGTVNTTTFTPTTTQFECSDITDVSSNPVYINRGYVITSGGLVKSAGTILGDIVGTSGRRFTVTANPVALANGDTILII